MVQPARMAPGKQEGKEPEKKGGETMTYEEIFMKWLQRILLFVLVAAIIGIAVSAVARSRVADKEIDALIARCDYWYERGQK